jgi:hypothetical protein
MTDQELRKNQQQAIEGAKSIGRLIGYVTRTFCSTARPLVDKAMEGGEKIGTYLENIK